MRPSSGLVSISCLIHVDDGRGGGPGGMDGTARLVHVVNKKILATFVHSEPKASAGQGGSSSWHQGESPLGLGSGLPGTLALIAGLHPSPEVRWKTVDSLSRQYPWLPALRRPQP